ncbi:MAG: PQQ-dependent sugar dehydrogenase [Trueperaceae bacterium]
MRWATWQMLRWSGRGAVRRSWWVATATVAVGLAAAQAPVPPPAAPLPVIEAATVALELQVLHDDLALPVSTTAFHDGSDRVLLVQLEGMVMLLENPAAPPRPFLDLRDRVTGLEGEQGLFTVALEPAERARARGHARNVVVAYTERGTGDVVVAGFPVDTGGSSADPANGVEILRVPMPEPFHHGGQVAFGPDGMLYVSIGNGEISNAFLHTSPASAQDLRSLRGKVLRLDAFPAHGGAYAVPADNPFVADAERDPDVRSEVWAYGFRNPWKFAFDPATGDLYLADVGSDRWEEIDLVEPGRNYGWPAREGPECQMFPDASGFVDPACPELPLEEPRFAYAHLALDPNGGQAVVGGIVVRDPGLPGLAGRYLFGDFVTGRLWSLDPATDRVELLLETGLALTGIDEGPRGQVLLTGVQGVLARLIEHR